MADQLSEAETAEYKEAFKNVDRQSDGEINAKQLGTLLRSLGQNPTQAELDDMVIEVDDDGDGAVDFQQFLTIMARTNQTAANDGEEIDAAFKAYDKDGTGYISAADLKNVMTSLGETLSDAELDEMIQDADTDSDGQINYGKLVAMLQS